MQRNSLLNIDLAQVVKEAQNLKIELNDNFFANLDQEEIKSGKVCLDLTIKALSDEIFTIKVNIKGIVTVLCDRCLEPLLLNVDVKEQVKIKSSTEEDSDSPNTVYVEVENNIYDASWLIYELIETSLPIQKVHKESECNPEMTRYITQISE